MTSIPIEEFILEVPTVNELVIEPIGSPVKDPVHNGAALPPGLYQYVYYALKRADGRKVEEGNKYIPKDIYTLIDKYIEGTVDAETITILRAFFEAADWAVIKPILPVTETEDESEA